MDSKCHELYILLTCVYVDEIYCPYPKTRDSNGSEYLCQIRVLGQIDIENGPL